MNCKRYLPPSQIEVFLSELPKEIKQEQLGVSVNGLPIHMLKLGTGRCSVLMWSQMHGNETTTTKALLDLIPWLVHQDQKALLEHFTFYIIPQLNPDGAKAYTRLNANQVDLNRDAIHLSQPESKILRSLFERTNPDYALNLHGQRTIYAPSKDDKVSTFAQNLIRIGATNCDSQTVKIGCGTTPPVGVIQDHGKTCDPIHLLGLRHHP